MTERTVAERINEDRMRANVIEAAEQCGILHIPEVHSPVALNYVLDAWTTNRRLIYCDEHGSSDPVATLKGLEPGPVAVLVGPEGGFSALERERLLGDPLGEEREEHRRDERADERREERGRQRKPGLAALSGLGDVELDPVVTASCSANGTRPAP